MNPVTLPPSPNWYQSSILTCGKDGTVAWGSVDSIVISKRLVNEEKILDYSIIRKAHFDKVNSIAFSPEFGEGKNLLLSGGHDNTIKIWNTDTLTLESSQYFTNKKETVACVDWSRFDVNVVCCISENGKILVWDTKYFKCNYIDPGKLSPTCISLCPHKANLAAVGSKNGLVYIVNLSGSEGVVYKLRGHDVEITSLSWCPTPANIFNEKAPKDLLLASGAKDKVIFIWRAGGDGRCETQLSLPPSVKDSHQHRTKLSPSIGCFTSLCWQEPRLLISSSIYGEVLSLELSSASLKHSAKWKVIHGNHLRGVFAISCAPQIFPEDEKDWKLPLKFDVWSIAQDRQVICCSVEKDNRVSTEYSIHTQGSFVYCMSTCNVDSSRIAYGAGDSLIRVWNSSEPHRSSFDITVFWQKIHGKVTSLAWHPKEENILAFATSEGRVGTLDTHSNSKPPTIYRQFHKHTVYSIGWGPKSGKAPGYTIFSCDDKQLIEYLFDKPNAEPKIVAQNCSEFAWSCDKVFLAIGCSNGTIRITNSKHDNVGLPIQELKKPILSLAWHPACTLTDQHESPYKNYLAAASMNSSILILDLTNMIEKFEKKAPSEEPAAFLAPYRVVAKLSGHVDKINCLAWSPHVSGKLVSGGADGIAQVWDIKEKKIIATYSGHLEPINCCMWSPISADLVMTGSKDFTLRVWVVSQQKPMIPKQKLEVKNSQKKVIVDLSDVNGVEDVSELMGKMKLTHKQRKSNQFLLKYRRMTKDKEDFRKECLKLVNQEKDAVLSIFGDVDDVTQILNLEIESYVEEENLSSAAIVNQFNSSNSLKQQLEDAAKELKLNDFLVSLAPSVSMKMWQDTCEAYATQLKMSGNSSKAATYFLCVSKVAEAIDVFLEAKMFREAYVLARCRLEKDDPTIKKILEKWGLNELKSGNFEDAAKCHIVLGELSKAAKILSRRSDVVILETAADLAKIAGDEDLTETITNQVISQSMIEMKFELTKRLLDKFPLVNYRLLQLKILVEIYNSVSAVDDNGIKVWLNGKSEYGLIDVVSKLGKEVKDAKDYIKVAESSYPDAQLENQLWFFVSHEITLSAIAKNEKTRTEHIVKALELIYQYEVRISTKSDDWKVSLLIKFISILEPKSPIVSLIAKNKEVVAQKSLKAFLCLSMLCYLVNKLQINTKDDSEFHLARRMIEATLTDALDPEAVKYWTLKSEIDKLKAELAETSISTEKDVSDERSKMNSEEILKQLDEIRAKKTKFIDDRIAIPNPLIVYSKAIDLCNLLKDEAVKKKLTKTINETWSIAVL